MIRDHRKHAALALALSALACRANAAQGPPAMPVKIQVARAVAVDDSSEYVATLKSRASAAIMPEVEGHITSIFVCSGTHVPAGAALSPGMSRTVEFAIQNLNGREPSIADRLRIDGRSLSSIPSRPRIAPAWATRV